MNNNLTNIYIYIFSPVFCTTYQFSLVVKVNVCWLLFFIKLIIAAITFNGEGMDFLSIQIFSNVLIHHPLCTLTFLSANFKRGRVESFSSLTVKLLLSVFV